MITNHFNEDVARWLAQTHSKEIFDACGLPDQVYPLRNNDVLVGWAYQYQTWGAPTFQVERTSSGFKFSSFTGWGRLNRQVTPYGDATLFIAALSSESIRDPRFKVILPKELRRAMTARYPKAPKAGIVDGSNRNKYF